MNRIIAQINSIAANPRTPIKNFFEFMLGTNRQTKRPELLPLMNGIDIDKVFMTLALKEGKKNPFHIDNESLMDLILDALTGVLSANAIKSYDPATREFVPYFGTMFQYRMRTEFHQYAQQKNKERDNRDDSEIGDDDYYDHHQDHHDNSPHHEMEYKKMLGDMLQKLGRERNGPQMQKMLQMLIEGHNSADIAEELGISKPAVSQWIEKLKEFIIEYAKYTKNDLLSTLMHGIMGSRTTKSSADSDTKPLFKLFHDYKKKTGHDELLDESSQPTFNRTPVGSITKLRVVQNDDITSKAYRLSMAEDPESSSSSHEDELDRLNEILSSADDIIEQGNRVSSVFVKEPARNPTKASTAIEHVQGQKTLAAYANSATKTSQFASFNVKGQRCTLTAKRSKDGRGVDIAFETTGKSPIPVKASVAPSVTLKAAWEQFNSTYEPKIGKMSFESYISQR